jgi:hypothetical protein
VATHILLAQGILTHRSVGEERQCLHIGTHGVGIALQLGVGAAQIVVSHSNAVVRLVVAIVGGSSEDERVGGQRHIALVVGLRGEQGIEGPGLATQCGVVDAIEHIPSLLGVGINHLGYLLQAVELPIAAATPEKEQASQKCP